MSKPLVSIVTPCFNCSPFIKETIDSIISQTYQNWELIITDDCSNDNSFEVIEQFIKRDNRIKHFKLETNSGAGVARNKSIHFAQGQYIAFCDSDDQWKPQKLEKQIQFMLKNDYGLTYTSYDVISEEGKSISRVLAKPRVNYAIMLRNNYIGCLTAIYDANKLGKMYMPEIRKRQDWALWLGILKRVDWAYGIEDTLAIYRDRSNSISSSKLEMMKYNWRIYHQVEKYSALKSAFFIMQFLYYYFLKKI